MDFQDHQPQEGEIISNRHIMENNEAEVESYTSGPQKEVPDIRTANLKCQVDTEKLIRRQAKQFVYTQEQYKLKNTTTLKKARQMEKYIDRLKTKKKEAERNIVEQQLMTCNEEKKIIESKNLTYSTREILNKLKNYIDGFRQSVSSLHVPMLNFYTESKYGNRVTGILDIVNMFENNSNEKNILKNSNKTLYESQKLNNENVKCEKSKKNLDNKFDKTLLQKLQIENDFRDLENIILEKDEENRKVLEELGEVTVENVELQVNLSDNRKLQSLKIQKLNFERDTLTERNALSKAHYVKIEQQLAEATLEKRTYEEQLNVFQESIMCLGIDLHELGSSTCSELELQTQVHYRANEEINKELSVLRVKKSKLIQSNYDTKAMLMKMESTVVDLQKISVHSQELYSNEKSHFKNLNEERMNLDKLLDEMSINMKNNTKVLEAQQQIEKEIKTNSEIRKSETIKQNSEFEYQQKVVLTYLETKLKDLNMKFIEIEKKISEEEHKRNEVQSFKIKKIEQCNRAQKYFELFQDTTRHTKSVLSIENQSENTPENEEKIEDEQPADETPTKSILKSQNSPGPHTPKKIVTFKNVPSIESSSSSCVMNNVAVTDTPSQITNLFDSLEPLQYKRNRNFD